MEPQQETSHDILESLLQELVEREEDFSFYISLCLRLLARSPQHGWDVKAFMRGLEPKIWQPHAILPSSTQTQSFWKANGSWANIPSFWKLSMRR